MTLIKKTFIYLFYLSVLHFSCGTQVMVAFCGIFCFGTQTLWLQYIGSKMHGSEVVAHEPSCSRTCGILVPQPGFKLMPPTLQGGSSTTGLPGNSLIVDTQLALAVCLAMTESFTCISQFILTILPVQRILNSSFSRPLWWLPTRKVG